MEHRTQQEQRDDEAWARQDDAPETSDEATDAGAGAPGTASLLHGDREDREDREDYADREDLGDREDRADREDLTAREDREDLAGGTTHEGADEQRTVPEDREAAATAEGRTTIQRSPNGEERPFELFEGADMDGYRRRWDALQASFVDDPRAAAEQADMLVGELVDQVTQRHQRLHDEVGGSSDEGDTEAMRLALRRYRAFYQTLVGERT